MKFGYTILYVPDVMKTISFYENAFGFHRGIVHESQDYAELQTGDTTLSFMAVESLKQMGHSPGRADNQNPTFEIALITGDVTAAVQKAISEGAILVQEPEDMPWGQTVGYVKDINGFLVEICSEVSGA